jgi:hypothetical protein
MLFYAEKSLVAAHRFLEAIDAAVAAIAQRPQTWPIYLHGTRR